jgi:hypothetical protein
MIMAGEVALELVFSYFLRFSSVNHSAFTRMQGEVYF